MINFCGTCFGGQYYILITISYVIPKMENLGLDIFIIE